jgi:hypothetical protein
MASDEEIHVLWCSEPLHGARCGEPPGTASLIEVGLPENDPVMNTHGWEPDKVLALASGCGAAPPPAYVVACERAAQLARERQTGHA